MQNDTMSGCASSKRSVCRYFLLRSCVKGDQCRFLHDESALNDQDSGPICDRLPAPSLPFISSTLSPPDPSSSPSASLLNSASGKQGGCAVGAISPNDDRSITATRRTIEQQQQKQQQQQYTGDQDGQGQSSKYSLWGNYIPNILDSDGNSGSSNAVTNNIPTCKPWSQVVKVAEDCPQSELTASQADDHLCPYMRQRGECVQFNAYVNAYVAASMENAADDGHVVVDLDSLNSLMCPYIHGEMCDLCGLPVLHPTHAGQREAHKKECVKQHEEAMERTFALARSAKMTCGICMEVVVEKESKTEARFGLLPSCGHCFCLTCIRQWRQERQYENTIVRSCPECRKVSDFVCPSQFWIEDLDEKADLISRYKSSMQRKECKYYEQGRGECPFGNKCFYRHADREGRLIDVGPPKRRPGPDDFDWEQFIMTPERRSRERRLDIQLNMLAQYLSDSMSVSVSGFGESDDENEDNENETDEDVRPIRLIESIYDIIG